jgi:hypothetical protein
LALSLLAGIIIKDPSSPGDVTVASDYNPIPYLVPRDHHILDLAYDALRPSLLRLLSKLAAFGEPVAYDEVKSSVSLGDERELKEALIELKERALLLFDQEQEMYDLHPIVRQYVCNYLKDRDTVRTRLRLSIGNTILELFPPI